MKILKSTAGGSLLTLICCFTSTTDAATTTGTNTVSGNWSGMNNWNANRVPGASDSTTITNSGTYVVTLDANAMVNSTILGDASGQQTLTTIGNALTLNSASRRTKNLAWAHDPALIQSLKGDRLKQAQSTPTRDQ